MEIWKDIPNYNGIYQVSNYGGIKRLNYRNSGNEKIITPKYTKQGYVFVALWKNGKYKNYYVHRLVGQAFLENPFGFPEINHRDENPSNNNINNLEWCSSSYNTRYSRKKHPERYVTTYKGKRTSRQTKYSLFEVNQKDKNGNIIKTWNNISEIVRELGYNNSSITGCCLGKRNFAYGYKWEFADKNASSLFI